jgi:hypothetical protein
MKNLTVSDLLALKKGAEFWFEGRLYTVDGTVRDVTHYTETVKGQKYGIPIKPCPHRYMVLEKEQIEAGVIKQEAA